MLEQRRRSSEKPCSDFAQVKKKREGEGETSQPKHLCKGRGRIFSGCKKNRESLEVTREWLYKTIIEYIYIFTFLLLRKSSLT